MGAGWGRAAKVALHRHLWPACGSQESSRQRVNDVSHLQLLASNQQKHERKSKRMVEVAHHLMNIQSQDATYLELGLLNGWAI